ncbi:unnamed protein product, partial [Discosporangium mesarthrocarpum]
DLRSPGSDGLRREGARNAHRAPERRDPRRAPGRRARPVRTHALRFLLVSHRPSPSAVAAARAGAPQADVGARDRTGTRARRTRGSADRARREGSTGVPARDPSPPRPALRAAALRGTRGAHRPRERAPTPPSRPLPRTPHRLRLLRPRLRHRVPRALRPPRPRRSALAAEHRRRDRRPAPDPARAEPDPVVSARPPAPPEDVPPGPRRVVIAKGFQAQPGAAALARNPAALLDRADVVAGGRSPHRALPARDWGTVVRVRPGRRGGLLGPLLGDRYATPVRCFREHALVESLDAEGLPVPTPVFAAAWRSGFGWRCVVATVERERAVDLAGWLDRSPSARARTAAARAIGRTLRSLHDAGVTHGDLQLRNLLLEPGSSEDAPRCLAIDFDRARRGSPLPPASRMREWMRLVRSFHRTGRDAALTARIRAAALAAYCGGDRELRRAMLHHLPRERARLHRHRLGW